MEMGNFRMQMLSAVTVGLTYPVRPPKRVSPVAGRLGLKWSLFIYRVARINDHPDMYVLPPPPLQPLTPPLQPLQPLQPPLRPLTSPLRPLQPPLRPLTSPPKISV